MYYQQFESLFEVIKKAGQLGCQMQGSIVRQEKKDGSLVTAADQALEELLRTEIKKKFPTDAILGEEQGLNTGLSNRTWVIDPIDGTADYANHLPTWAISVGLFEQGQSCGGICFVPLLNRFYLAADGKSYLNGQQLQIKNLPIKISNFTSVNAGTFAEYQVNPNTRCWTSPSAINPCLVADGTTIGCFTLNCAIWDLAVSVPVLQNAGGHFEYLNGKEFSLNKMFAGEPMTQPILGGTKEFIQEARNWFKLK